MSVPKLRFPEFSGEYDSKFLGDLSKIATGRLDANAMRDDGEYTFFTCAKETYKIDQYAFDTEALLISGNGANVGYIHYYKGKFNAYQRTYVLDGFEENIKYIEYFLQKNLRNRIYSEVKEGNTPYIVKGTLAEMEVFYPSLPEQQKIASFLSSVDKKIDLLRQKKNALELYKKGLMQKIFSQEIRFKTDDGNDFPDWEEVALGDVLSEYTEKNSGNFSQYTIGKNGVKPIISPNYETLNHKVFKVGDLIVGIGIDEVNLNWRIEYGCCSPVYTTYSVDSAVLNCRFGDDYLKYFLPMHKNKICRKSTRRDFEVQKRELLKLSLHFPCLDEQKKIASFLSALDVKIQKTSAQIEQMETFKKGLLQQMFV